MATNPIIMNPKTVHSYLVPHSHIVNDFISYIDELFDKESDSLIVDHFENQLQLLFFECEYLNFYFYFRF